MSKSELACTYAALILHDDKVPITADKINSILGAAKVEVEGYWPSLFARVLASKNLDDLIMSAGAGSGPAVAAPVSTGAPAKEEKKEEAKGKKKEEPKEEEDEDMGFGLFD